MNTDRSLVEEEDIIDGTIVVDVVYPKITKLLTMAKGRAKHIIDGEKIFIAQAMLQQNIWQKNCRYY